MDYLHTFTNQSPVAERERGSARLYAWASLRFARGRICQRLDAHFNTKLINHLSGAGWQNMRAQQLISLSRGARNLTPPLTIILSSLSSLASRAGFAFLLARYVLGTHNPNEENKFWCVLQNTGCTRSDDLVLRKYVVALNRNARILILPFLSQSALFILQLLY